MLVNLFLEENEKYTSSHKGKQNWMHGKQNVATEAYLPPKDAF